MTFSSVFVLFFRLYQIQNFVTISLLVAARFLVLNALLLVRV